MKDLLVLLAPGFEEVEALTVVDLCRRAGLKVDLVSCRKKEKKTVKSSHGVKIRADKHMHKIKDEGYRAIYIPGGMGGATSLAKNPKVLKYLQKQPDDVYIAAICAGPLVLHAAGLDVGKIGTIYPGMEDQCAFKSTAEALVVRDGNIITSKGPGTAAALGFYLVKLLKDEATMDALKEATLVPQVLAAVSQGDVVFEA